MTASVFSGKNASFLIWRSLVRFPWGTAPDVVYSLIRTLQGNHLIVQQDDPYCRRSTYRSGRSTVPSGYESDGIVNALVSCAHTWAL